MKKRSIFILAVIYFIIGGIHFSLQASQLGPFLADTAELTETHQFVLQVIPSFFIKQGIYDEEGKRQSLPDGDRQCQLPTVFKPIYGLYNNFEISIEFPVQYNWVTQANRSGQSGGVGDILLIGKYRFIEDDRNGFLPAVTGIGKVKFPTGKYENLSEPDLRSDSTGNGSYEYIAGVNFTKFVENWVFHLNLAFDWVTETTIDDVRTKPGNIINYNIAVEYSFAKKSSFLLELIGMEQGISTEMNQHIEKSDVRSLSLLPALSWEISEKVFILMGCSFSILGKNTDYGFTPAILYNYNF